MKNDNKYLDEQFHYLYETLVPEKGEANTINGELIRAVGRLEYEYLNNGNCNAYSFEDELYGISSMYFNFLELIEDEVPNSKGLVNAIRFIIKSGNNTYLVDEKKKYVDLQNHVTTFVINQIRKEKIESIIT